MQKNLLPTAVTPAPPELATQAHEVTPRYCNFSYSATEPTPVPRPDRRAAGSNVLDLRNEQTTL